MKTALAIAALALGIGCAGKTPAPGEITRPIGEDPLALMPSGQDLIADLDVVQLRGWEPTQRFLRLLPDEARARLDALGFDPLQQVDGLVAAVAHLGTKEAAGTILLSGDFELDKLRQGLGRSGDLKDTLYHDVAVADGPLGSLARILPRMVVLGSQADVRRVIDLSHGDGESLRATTADRRLLAAFTRTPTAKDGRPAIRLALVPPDPLRDELARQELPFGDLEWLALSIAVGDGFDVGGIAGVGSADKAGELVAQAQARIKEFGSRVTVRMLGLGAYLDPIVLRPRENEVHFAYRLTAPTVARLLDKLEAVRALAGRPRHQGSPQKELDR